MQSSKVTVEILTYRCFVVVRLKNNFFNSDKRKSDWNNEVRRKKDKEVCIHTQKKTDNNDENNFFS